MHSTAPNSDAHKAIHTVLCGVHFSVIVALAPTDAPRSTLVSVTCHWPTARG